jgi:hypothetical protein
MVNLRVLQDFNGILPNLISGLHTKIWTPDLPNTKQESYPLDRNVRYNMIMAIIGIGTDLVQSVIQQSRINAVIL